MLAKERKDIILEKLDTNLTVNVRSLANELNVTMETIRKDLQSLSDSYDRIVRIHGGAYIIQSVESIPYSKKIEDVKLIKMNQAISKLAVDQVCNEDILMLDSSKKCIYIVQELIRRNIKATIITNSLPSANIIASSKNLKLFCLGGNLNIPTCSFKGNFTLQTLKNMHCDKAFLSPTAISMNFGISHKDEFEAQIAKAMILNSNKVFLVMQDSKFDKSTLTKIGGIADIDVLISFNQLSDKWNKVLKDNNVDSIYSQI